VNQPPGEKKLRRLQTNFIVGLCVLFLLSQGGCATRPVTLAPEIQAQLGRVGVVSAQYTPAVEFELPAKGKLGGAGRGAVRGTGPFIVLVPSFTLAGFKSAINTPDSLVGAFVGAAVGAMVGVGYMIGGPISGVVLAEAKEVVEESEAQL